MGRLDRPFRESTRGTCVTESSKFMSVHATSHGCDSIGANVGSISTISGSTSYDDTSASGLVNRGSFKSSGVVLRNEVCSFLKNEWNEV